jgi:hypothetical protein
VLVDFGYFAFDDDGQSALHGAYKEACEIWERAFRINQHGVQKWQVRRQVNLRM